ncbi:MAG: nucleoside recognition domain-containing protein [Candidatus Omnitrophica bacterium]|nr:nucleoside recognition domain-containing protein [Candidatus Omnitrophota bacterium]MDD5653295.1 nucleoside recognition domain-containing protein [Candidatus Omnitrophota bacterium]
MSKSFAKHIGYDDPLEIYLSRLEGLLSADYRISRRSVALLILQEDKEILNLVQEKEKTHRQEIAGIIEEAKKHFSHPLNYIISLCRQKEAALISGQVMSVKKNTKNSLRSIVSRAMMNPFIGGPFLLLVLYYGLYKFVGVFGAGVLVNFLEEHIFSSHVNPIMISLVKNTVHFQPLQDLLVGDYGIITLGFRYAFAIILPIVATFFFAFAIIEDTGYLPRLAMLVDQLFKKIGLSGRAVIPLVLGLGCSTMATIVTRTLPTKRERIIATLLLALAIPCSAQMGVIMGLLGDKPLGLVIWLLVIIGVFLIVGFLAAKIMPGELPSFYMEIPPLRLPHLWNILRKTFVRLKWYFFEVLPLFVFASVFIWLGQLTGVFNFLVKIMEYPIRLIGLPSQASVAFLFGFFRRDYGAAGLYDLKKAGLLSGNQLVIGCITLTLFLPCIAQLLMNIKERGLRLGIAMSVFILFFSFAVGFAVSQIFLLFHLHI